jgi:hypothetical protein
MKSKEYVLHCTTYCNQYLSTKPPKEFALLNSFVPPQLAHKRLAIRICIDESHRSSKIALQAMNAKAGNQHVPFEVMKQSAGITYQPNDTAVLLTDIARAWTRQEVKIEDAADCVVFEVLYTILGLVDCYVHAITIS